MKIFVLTLGTRGDVETFLVLGRELCRRGHRVMIGTSPFYSEAIQKSGMESLAVGTSTPDQQLRALESVRAIDDLSMRTSRFIDVWLGPQLRHSVRDVFRLAMGADYFISNLRMTVPRKNQIVPGALVTYDLPASTAEPIDYPRPADPRRIIELVALNKTLADPDRRWGPDFCFTGFWHDETAPAWTAKQRLLDFLHRGPPPIVFTLGSMEPLAGPGPAKIFADALKLIGRRGIILQRANDATPGESPNSEVHFDSDIPYRWLFPRAGAVVHHGGVGTVAATIAVGVSSVILPQISAQQYMGDALLRSRLAAAVLDSRRIQPHDLAEAIRTACDGPRFIQTARDWKKIVAADRGAAYAADLIEQHARQLGLQQS